MDALRPLLARGPVFLVKNADGGADARITIRARAGASAAMMHRVITTPGEYTTFMPILSSVELLSSRGTRTAFRFHVAASLFDVTALCAMNDLSERRVDVAITHSETGPGGSRWDLTPDGDAPPPCRSPPGATPRRATGSSARWPAARPPPSPG